jgi:hypothetical protein
MNAAISALAADAARAHAKQERRTRTAEKWCDKGQKMAEGALRMHDPDVTARWYLWSGYCRWLATRDTCLHRAAAQLALGFREHAQDNVAAARYAMREARKARLAAERAVA